MKFANLLLCGLLAASPAFSTVIADIQASLAGGDLGGDLLCAGVTGDPSFSIQLGASGEAFLGDGAASVSLNALSAFLGYDETAFLVETDISINLLAQGFFVVTGGIGPGFVSGSGSFQGAASGPDASFFAISAINGVICDDFFGDCQNLIPITFGQPFEIIALANASLHSDTASVSSAAGTGDASVTRIYDANGVLLPDAQIHLVPEPVTSLLLAAGILVLLIQQRVVQHKRSKIRQRG